MLHCRTMVVSYSFSVMLHCRTRVVSYSFLVILHCRTKVVSYSFSVMVFESNVWLPLWQYVDVSDQNPLCGKLCGMNVFESFNLPCFNVKCSAKTSTLLYLYSIQHASQLPHLSALLAALWFLLSIQDVYFENKISLILARKKTHFFHGLK
jgi:hypothetical protein